MSGDTVSALYKNDLDHRHDGRGRVRLAKLTVRRSALAASSSTIHVAAAAAPATLPATPTTHSVLAERAATHFTLWAFAGVGAELLLLTHTRRRARRVQTEAARAPAVASLERSAANLARSAACRARAGELRAGARALGAAGRTLGGDAAVLSCRIAGGLTALDGSVPAAATVARRRAVGGRPRSIGRGGRCVGCGAAAAISPSRRVALIAAIFRRRPAATNRDENGHPIELASQ